MNLNFLKEIKELLEKIMGINPPFAEYIREYELLDKRLKNAATDFFPKNET